MASDPLPGQLGPSLEIHDAPHGDHRRYVVFVVYQVRIAEQLHVEYSIFPLCNKHRQRPRIMVHSMRALEGIHNFAGSATFFPTAMLFIEEASSVLDESVQSRFQHLFK